MEFRVSPEGQLTVEGRPYPCALGRGGLGRKAREGDGLTPIGSHPLRSVFFRPDRLDQPSCALPVQAIKASDGWCDDPNHSAYNQLITRPFSASHEELWREDHLYDLIIVVGFNDDPIIAGAGSAIFIHVAQPDFRPTEGCVALAKPDLLRLVGDLTPESRLVVQA